MIYHVTILMVIVVGIISKDCSLMRWIGSKALVNLTSNGFMCVPQKSSLLFFVIVTLF